MYCQTRYCQTGARPRTARVRADARAQRAPAPRARASTGGKDQPPQAPALWPRLQQLALGGALTGLLALQPAALAEGQETPFTQANQITFGVQNGRIQACPGAVNPNCVSTSSTNDMYAPAWRSTATSARAALQDLEASMVATQKGALKVLEAETPYGAYVAYSVPGFFGKPDMVEFLVKEGGVTDRDWQGDRPGPVVLYRSIAGGVKYIWPITQPVSDLDTQKKRMASLRADLEWPVVGCELLECYGDINSSDGWLLGNFRLR